MARESVVGSDGFVRASSAIGVGWESAWQEFGPPKGMNGATAGDEAVTVTRVGLLGASGIAPRAIIAPAKRRADVSIVAVASRSEATDYAQHHGIARVHANYQALIDDSEVDLVYVALPPSEHARWTIAALAAGKDVLCEKPFAMNAVEADEVAQAVERTGRRVVEAFHDYYHPLFQWVRGYAGSWRLASSAQSMPSPLSSTRRFRSIVHRFAMCQN
ncbi:Gfo/Idh/MocA family oxidoreductase [Microbacterium sp. NPDC076911]|uniref:Gfo/Idh/MocA family protein n=1 Tax=Microbacterium sp. NPDC076911 TaxID=3154958 RepID=UPI00342C67E7